MSTQTSTKPSKLTVQKILFRNADDLTHQEFRVMAVLLTYTDEHCRSAYPGQPALMAAIGCKDRKRMSDLLKSLEAKGYLRKTGEHKYTGRDGRNLAQEFDVVIPAHIMAKELGTDVDNPLLVDHANDSSTGDRGVLSTPGGGVLTTPSSDHASGPKNPYTVNADASPAPKDSKDGKGKVVHMSPTRMLHHEARHLILDAMMGVTGPNCIHVDNVLDLLTEHYSETVSGYAANYWTFRTVADEYEAAKQLNLLVHTVARDLGDEYLIPDNAQVAA